ncbi:hypothetical protein KIPB_010821, partial [Kipferlia bialata]
ASVHGILVSHGVIPLLQVVTSQCRDARASALAFVCYSKLSSSDVCLPALDTEYLRGLSDSVLGSSTVVTMLFSFVCRLRRRINEYREAHSLPRHPLPHDALRTFEDRFKGVVAGFLDATPVNTKDVQLLQGEVEDMLESLISLLDSPEERRQCVGLGVPSVVLRVLTECGGSSELMCRSALCVLYALSLEFDDVTTRSLAESGIVPTIKKALMSHQSSTVIARFGLECLSRLSRQGSLDLQLVEAGYHRWALELVYQHLHDGDVVRLALEVLHQLQGEDADTGETVPVYPGVSDYLVKEGSLRTLMAALNYHMDSADTAQCIAKCLARVAPHIGDTHRESRVLECLERYSKKYFDEEMCQSIQNSAARGRMLSALQTPNAPSPLSESDIETLIEHHLNKSYHNSCSTKGSVELPRGIASRTLPPNQARVLYLPDIGEKRIAGFCATLEKCGLSTVNVTAAKNPSALKRELASGTQVPPVSQVVVCTHDTVLAREGSKAYRLHMCVWREMVR